VYNQITHSSGQRWNETDVIKVMFVTSTKGQ